MDTPHHQPNFVDAAVQGDLIVYDLLLPRVNRRFWQTKKRGSLRLFKPLVFTATTDTGQVYWWDAPAHMETDGYSYPIRPKWIRGRTMPAIGHDRLYTHAIMWHRDTGAPLVVERRTADHLFQLLLQDADFPGLFITTKHVGVTVGGWYGWNKSRKKELARFEPLAGRSWLSRPTVHHIERPETTS